MRLEKEKRNLNRDSPLSYFLKNKNLIIAAIIATGINIPISPATAIPPIKNVAVNANSNNVPKIINNKLIIIFTPFFHYRSWIFCDFRYYLIQS